MVSVIIPNYNHAGFLRQRIESVLNQTYRHFEIIILDDASTDESRDVIEAYRNNEHIVDIVYNERNSGSTFLQWEKGIALCRSEYIWIAESDDWCEPSFLQTLVKPLQENPTIIVAYSQSYAIGKANRINWISESPSLESVAEGHTFVRDHMLMNTAIFNASMAVWRRSAFQNVSKEYTNFRYCGDWLFWIELCRQGSVFISGRMLNYFRMHDADVSTRMLETGDGLIEEARMFRLLYSRNWISSADLESVLRQLYIRFRESGYRKPEKTLIASGLFPDQEEKKLCINITWHTVPELE